MSIHLGTEHFIDEICVMLERSYPGIRVEFNFTGTEKTNTGYLLHYSFPHVPLFVFSNTCPEAGVLITDDLTLAELEELLKTTLQLSVKILLLLDGYWVRNSAVGRTRLEKLTREPRLQASIA